MNGLDGIFYIFIEFAKQMAPDFSNDPVNQYFLLQTIRLIGIFTVLAVLFLPLQYIKPRRRRIKAAFIVGAFCMNIFVVWVINNRDETPFQLSDDLILIVMNLLFLSIYFLPRVLRKISAHKNSGANLELQLSKEVSKRLIMKACPGCGNHTISQPLAFHTPQTCDRCGRCYRVSKFATAVDVLVVALYLLLCLALFYYYLQTVLTKVTMILVGAAAYFAMILFLRRARQFIEIDAKSGADLVEPNSSHLRER